MNLNSSGNYNMNDYPLYVIHGRIFPYCFERTILGNRGSIISFSDSLLLGPSSPSELYPAATRYDFWKKVYQPLNRKRIEYSDFQSETDKYEKIREHLRNGRAVVFLCSNDPNDTLLLWSLSPLFEEHYTEKGQILFSCYTTPGNFSFVRTRRISSDASRYMRDRWNDFVNDKYSLCENHGDSERRRYSHCPKEFWLATAIEFLRPETEEFHFSITKIDKTLIKSVPVDKPVPRSEILGNSHLKFADLGIGEIYLFYRLHILENVFKAIESSSDSVPHDPKYIRTSLRTVFSQ